MIATKPKTCRVCKSSFTPARPLAKVCSPMCGLAWGRMVRERKQAKEHKVKIKEKKQEDRGWWLKKVEKSFNGWVRLRDAGRPCISCGRHHQGQWHAGHFKTVAAHPELRFEPLNVWKQCQPCNTHLHGNSLLYRASLVKEIGIEKVEWLEGPHELKNYSIDDLKELDVFYTAKAKALRERAEA